MDFVSSRCGCGPYSRAGWLFLRRVLRASAFVVLFAASWPQYAAQSDVQRAEYKVKAVFLYRFASYVEWPRHVWARSDSPLVIGVIGADTLGDELTQAVAERTVDGRPVTIRKLRRGEPITGLHMLFIGRSEGVHVADVLASAKDKAVLTVTESEDAFPRGSMINLVVADDKVRFDVALQPAQLADLKISARLLGLARNVISNPS